MSILSKITAGLSVAVLSLGVSGGAFAGVAFGDGGAALTGVLNGITTGTTSIDVVNDQQNPDEYWAIGATGGSISTIVIELAAFAPNTTFGIFDKADSTKKVELFSGAASTGAQALVSILGDGSVTLGLPAVDTGIDFAANNFGFYIFVGNTGNTYYSDMLLNADSLDHLAVYEGVGDIVTIAPYAAGPWGSNEYILAWEDIYGGGDRDYTDFVVLVESITPTVPEPAILGFLGFGLLGMGLAARRRRMA